MPEPWLWEGIDLAERIDRPDLKQQLADGSGTTSIVKPSLRLLREAPDRLAEMFSGREDGWEDAFDAYNTYVDSLKLGLSDL